MATPDSIGQADCLNCGREVYVRKNRGGFAYCRCEGCGVNVQHHIMRHSEAFIRNRVRLEGEPESREKPQKAAPSAVEKTEQPISQPAKSSGEKPQKAAPVMSASEKFLRGVA